MRYIKIKTTAEVWKSIRMAHPELVVFSSFSNPDGYMFGGSGEIGVMETSFGFDGRDFPTIEARTSWDIDPDQPYVRGNEKHEYWLCVGVEEE